VGPAHGETTLGCKFPTHPLGFSALFPIWVPRQDHSFPAFLIIWNLFFLSLPPRMDQCRPCHGSGNVDLCNFCVPDLVGQVNVMDGLVTLCLLPAFSTSSIRPNYVSHGPSCLLLSLHLSRNRTEFATVGQDFFCADCPTYEIKYS